MHSILAKNKNNLMQANVRTFSKNSRPKILCLQKNSRPFFTPKLNASEIFEASAKKLDASEFFEASKKLALNSLVFFMNKIRLM